MQLDGGENYFVPDVKEDLRRRCFDINFGVCNFAEYVLCLLHLIILE